MNHGGLDNPVILVIVNYNYIYIYIMFFPVNGVEINHVTTVLCEPRAL